jgi:uncharacterized membrane protein
MAHFLKVYLLLIPVLFAIDFLWLGVLMPNFYKTELGPLARTVDGALTPVRWAAIMVYLLIPLGIVLFALPHVSTDEMMSTALLWGFLYGIVLYGVYDMTNYSLVKGWPLRMAVVDIVWGGVLCAAGTVIAAILDRRLFPV